MRELRHPAIVRVVDWLEDRLRIYIVMELCKGGELFDRIVEKVRHKTSTHVCVS
jgi:serine/threonine protein kinase